MTASPPESPRETRRSGRVSYTIRLARIVGRLPLISDALFWYYCYVSPTLDPPQIFNFVGFPNYSGIGRGYFDNMRRLGGVRPEHDVLDVGCGIGRVAVHYTGFLNAESRYEGFDVVQKGPRWCKQKIGRRFPNFSFCHANVYNRHYNRRGTISASEYRFPYESESFDFVFATSVFTHMLPDAVGQYLSEIERVLRPGGRAFLSYFVLNDVSRQHMMTSEFNFRRVDDRYSVMSEKDPEAAIAYDESFIKRMHDEAGIPSSFLFILATGAAAAGVIGGQDVVVAEKAG